MNNKTMFELADSPPEPAEPPEMLAVKWLWRRIFIWFWLAPTAAAMLWWLVEGR